MARLLILVTNDDGYNSHGIKALRDELSDLGRVVICAPEREHSGASHSLTLDRPLRLLRMEKDVYAVTGTPTDSVMMAVHGLLRRHPDIIVSGINHGPNLADDVTYSGTVAAAMEGTLLGIPSIAISQVNPRNSDFSLASRFARKLVALVAQHGLPQDTLLNVNVPGGKKGSVDKFRVTRQGRRIFSDVIHEKIDPRGQKYFWIAGEPEPVPSGKGTDLAAVKQGYISVTPIHLDLTYQRAIPEIRKWLK